LALVEELGLDPGVDTLSRWMAHYIAELIEDVETANPDTQSARFARCAEAILGLWERRHQLPDGKRPFEDWEPIVRTLESLDPSDEAPRYFRPQRMDVDEDEESDETRTWLQLVDGLDVSARILIRYCLARAAESALDKSRKWVSLAESAGLDQGVDLSLVRIVTAESALLKTDNPSDIERRRLEDRIGRLEGFREMAATLASDLEKQLDEAGPPKELTGD